VDVEPSLVLPEFVLDFGYLAFSGTGLPQSPNLGQISHFDSREN